MQQKDRDRLLVLATLLGCLLLFFGFIKGVKYIPPYLLILVCIIIQQLYSIPKLVSGYYKMYGQYIGISRFIPVYNEMCIMSERKAGIYLTLCILTLLAGFSSFINPAKIGSVFGVAIALKWNNVMLVSTIFLFIVLCIFRGVVYIGVFRDIQIRWSEYAEYAYEKSTVFNNAMTLIEGVRYVLLFIPILRTIAITYQFNTLNKLVGYGNYEVDAEDEDTLEEER